MSEYVPAFAGEMAAMLDAEAQQAREAQRGRAEVARLVAIGAEGEMLARALVGLSLADAGYHQHKGQWGMRRNVG